MDRWGGSGFGRSSGEVAGRTREWIGRERAKINVHLSSSMEA